VRRGICIKAGRGHGRARRVKPFDNSWENIVIGLRVRQAAPSDARGAGLARFRHRVEDLLQEGLGGCTLFIRHIAVNTRIAEARRYFSPREIVEATLAIGYYMTMTRLTEVTQTDLDPSAGMAVFNSAQSPPKEWG
jgi:hypothetical protein